MIDATQSTFLFGAVLPACNREAMHYAGSLTDWITSRETMPALAAELLGSGSATKTPQPRVTDPCSLSWSTIDLTLSAGIANPHGRAP